MIRQGLYFFPEELTDERGPFVSKERAMRFCGCSIFVGVWVKQLKANPEDPKAGLGTIQKPCCDEHREQMRKVHAAYEQSHQDGERPELQDLDAVIAADVVLHEEFPEVSV